MENMTNIRVTKVDMFEGLLAIIDGLECSISEEELKAFCNKEIETLRTKSARAKAKAIAKKSAGDELRQRVYEVLDTDEFISLADIAERIDDEDVTVSKITARLTQLINANMVEKTEGTAETKEGKKRVIMTYRKLETEDIDE